MKAYYIFQQADEETISNILDWMRNQERAIYRAAVRELGALKKLRPEFIQRKPLQEQFSFIKKMLSWKPSNEIGDHLLQVWLLRKHQDMLITFLNTLGIPHDGNGIVNELPETLDKEKLAKAVDELFEKYPAGVASVYLQMFQLQTEDGCEELAEVLANDPRVTIRCRYSPPGYKQGPLRSGDGPFYGGNRPARRCVIPVPGGTSVRTARDLFETDAMESMPEAPARQEGTLSGCSGWNDHPSSPWYTIIRDMPPSMTRFSALTKLEPHRKKTAFTISSGEPTRPEGC